MQLGITPQTLGDLLKLGITPPPLPLIDPDPTEPNIVICDRYGVFPDDVHGTCADCGEAIAWRPHNPDYFIKVCMRCARQRQLADRD
jgi:hypothetical protein